MPKGTTPRNTDSGRSWVKWILWFFAGLALLLLLLEHRAHALGGWLHAILGLCVVLLHLIVRFDGNDSGADGNTGSGIEENAPH